MESSSNKKISELSPGTPPILEQCMCKQLIATLLVVRSLGFVSVLVQFDWLSIRIFYATLVVKIEI